ncbi:uncharacterized protein LOC119595495 [Penaeus monodon]|uniref:uncharacterized protein LOC119595495 n=1 Tax=Penaeus monodon TaxID=6687 RepID=UPI0018A75A59|nr:uncharacterized protein LOC119595495 [Penaeus monodon]
MRMKVFEAKFLLLLFQLLVAVVMVLTMLTIFYRKEKGTPKETLYQKYGIEHIFRDERDPNDVYGQSVMHAMNPQYMQPGAPLQYMQQQPGAGGQFMQQVQYKQQGPPAPNAQQQPALHPQQPAVAKDSAAGSNGLVQNSPEFEIVPSAKNVTPHDARLLVYNRVPKCGSTTVLDILNFIITGINICTASAETFNHNR